MLSPDGLAEHKDWPGKTLAASSALPGIHLKEEQDVLVKGEPLTCSHGATGTLRHPCLLGSAGIQRSGVLLLIHAFCYQSVP